MKGALAAAKALKLCRCHAFQETTSCERCVEIARALAAAFHGGWRDGLVSFAEGVKSVGFEAALHLAKEDMWVRTEAALGRRLTDTEKAIGEGAVNGALAMAADAAEAAARK